MLVFLTYRLQQEELRKTSEALSNQNDQLKIQHFENTFFKLLERKDHLIDNLRYRRETGFNALQAINKSFKNDIQQGSERNKALKNFWFHRAILISLVNNFITTIEYLDTSDFSGVQQIKKKNQLINIYTSSLSTYEKRTLSLIFEYFQVYEPENKDINHCRKLIDDWNVFSNKTTHV